MHPLQDSVRTAACAYIYPKDLDKYTFKLHLNVTCIIFFQAIHQTILDNNFVIVRSKDLVWKRQDSERFYVEHSGMDNI